MYRVTKFLVFLVKSLTTDNHKQLRLITELLVDQKMMINYGKKRWIVFE